jgi:hypothetical protein
MYCIYDMYVSNQIVLQLKHRRIYTAIGEYKKKDIIHCTGDLTGQQ